MTARPLTKADQAAREPTEQAKPWRIDLIESSPVTQAMIRACEAVPDGLIATTIPVAELHKFCKAFLSAYGVGGNAK